MKRILYRKPKIASSTRLLHVLKNIVVTEKSTTATQNGQYTFSVDRGANKNEIKQAVEKVFKVNVEKVNTLLMPAKQKRFRGRLGVRAGVKKAIVRLKAGQTIDMEYGHGA
jgi:large subunit ribosomal protein L23